jgi:hypothetical protein
MVSNQKLIAEQEARAHRDRYGVVDRCLVVLFWGTVLAVYAAAVWVAFLGAWARASAGL